VAVRHTLRAAGVDDRALPTTWRRCRSSSAIMTGTVRIRRTDDETYHYLVDMVRNLTGSTTPGNGPSASRASRQLQPLARRAVSGLHRRPALS